jgi:dTDP-4-dehydrorhamnose 3,5-epimerase
MQFRNATMPGVVIVETEPHTDARGLLSKPFHSAAFQRAGIDFYPKETFYSTSLKGVIRGMHFQAPPCAFDKYVFCTRGSVVDVLLDLRATNKGEITSYLLHSEGIGIFIPPGVAHGFQALEDNSTLVYMCSKHYEVSCDKGVRWDSIGYYWPLKSPIVSSRDSELPALADFESPFK